MNKNTKGRAYIDGNISVGGKVYEGDFVTTGDFVGRHTIVNGQRVDTNSTETNSMTDDVSVLQQRVQRAEYAVRSLKLALEHSHKENARLTDAVNALAANRATNAPVHPVASEPY